MQCAANINFHYNPPVPERKTFAAFAILALAAASGCESGNFSQYAGFAEIRAALHSAPPNAAARELLAQNKPQIFLAPEANPADGPLDFYADYIAHGELVSGKGERITSPTAADLNKMREDKLAIFAHIPPRQKTITPVAYGGIREATVSLPGVGDIPVVFLSYHFVFRQSGLPAGVQGFRRKAADIVGDSRDWHQLDHYTAVFLALYKNKPFAMMLQQHNYMRTYLINEDEAFVSGAPAKVDAALYSNELYPHRRARAKRAAAGFMSAGTIGWLTQTEPQPRGFNAAEDITEGAQEINYEMRYLPPNDAFYVFEGYLGERRILPGRDGPPGAIYRTTPALWNLEESLPAFHWKEGDKEYAKIYRKEGESEKAMQLLRQRFAQSAKPLFQNP